MAVPFRSADNADPPTGRRALALVGPPPVDPEAGIGRGVFIGAIAGFLGVGTAVALGGWAGGMVPGAALGFGAFVGSWGGAGFGAMLGGTVAFTRGLEAEHPA